MDSGSGCWVLKRADRVIVLVRFEVPAAIFRAVSGEAERGRLSLFTLTREFLRLCILRGGSEGGSTLKVSWLFERGSTWAIA